MASAVATIREVRAVTRLVETLVACIIGHVLTITSRCLRLRLSAIFSVLKQPDPLSLAYPLVNRTTGTLPHSEMEAIDPDVVALTGFLEREYPSLSFLRDHALTFEDADGLGADYIDKKAVVGHWNDEPVYGYMKCGTSRSLRQVGCYVVQLSCADIPTQSLADSQIQRIKLVSQLEGVLIPSSEDEDEDSANLLMTMIRAAFILQGYTSGRPAKIYDNFDSFGRAFSRMTQIRTDEVKINSNAGGPVTQRGEFVHRTSVLGHHPPSTSSSISRGSDWVALEKLFSEYMDHPTHTFIQSLRWASSEREGAHEKLYVGTRKERDVWAYFQRTPSDNCVLKILQEGTTGDICRTELNAVDLCPSFDMVPRGLAVDYRGNLVRYLWKACFVLRGHSAGYPVTVNPSFINHLSRILSWCSGVAGEDRPSETPTERNSGHALAVESSEAFEVTTETKQHSSTRLSQTTEIHAAKFPELTDESLRRAESPNENNTLPSPTNDTSVVFMGEATMGTSMNHREPVQDSSALQHQGTSSWSAINMPTQSQEPAQSSNGQPSLENAPSATKTQSTQPVEPAQSSNVPKRTEDSFRDTENELRDNETSSNGEQAEEDDHIQTPEETASRLSEYFQIHEDQGKAINSHYQLSVLRRGYVQELEDLAKQLSDETMQLMQQCRRVEQEFSEAIDSDQKDFTLPDLIEEVYNRRRVEADTRRAALVNSAKARTKKVESRISTVKLLDTEAEKGMKVEQENINNLKRRRKKLMAEGGFALGFAVCESGHGVVGQAKKRRRVE